MRFICLLTTLLIAGCGGGMIDVTGVTPPDSTVLVKHKHFRDLRAGDDIFRRHDLCFASHYTLKNKSDVLIDYVNNVTGQK